MIYADRLFRRNFKEEAQICEGNHLSESLTYNKYTMETETLRTKSVKLKVS